MNGLNRSSQIEVSAYVCSVSVSVQVRDSSLSAHTNISAYVCSVSLSMQVLFMSICECIFTNTYI